jgi:predicted small lipoprotein YifL
MNLSIRTMRSPIRLGFALAFVVAAVAGCGGDGPPPGNANAPPGDANVPPSNTSGRPNIILSSSSLSFSATAGAADPAMQMVSVASDGQPLSGLAAQVSYGAGGSGWLTASLSAANAPANLMVQPATGNLAAGTYAADVSIASSSAGNSPQAVHVTFTVSPHQAAARRITIRNSKATTDFLTDVVRIKVAATEGTPRSNTGVFVPSDLLTSDPASCLDLPGDGITPGHSRTFDVTVGSNYSVFIGIGKWDLDNFLCPASRPWFKETWFTQSQTGTMWWVWRTINVSNHTEGTWEWTVSGSYLNGTLKVVPAGNAAIPFVLTQSDPIP